MRAGLLASEANPGRRVRRKDRAGNRCLGEPRGQGASHPDEEHNVFIHFYTDVHQKMWTSRGMMADRVPASKDTPLPPPRPWSTAG